MKIFNEEKAYLVTGIIGFITMVIALPIAVRHFCIESTIFSALVPSMVIASLISIFSFSVYTKGRFRLYKASILEAKKLLPILLVNIMAIIWILN